MPRRKAGQQRAIPHDKGEYPIFTTKLHVVRYSPNKSKQLGILTFVTHDVDTHAKMGHVIERMTVPSGCSGNMETFVTINRVRVPANSQDLIQLAEQAASIAQELRAAERKADAEEQRAAE